MNIQALISDPSKQVRTIRGKSAGIKPPGKKATRHGFQIEDQQQLNLDTYTKRITVIDSSMVKKGGNIDGESNLAGTQKLESEILMSANRDNKALGCWSDEKQEEVFTPLERVLEQGQRGSAVQESDASTINPPGEITRPRLSSMTGSKTDETKPKGAYLTLKQ